MIVVGQPCCTQLKVELWSRTTVLTDNIILRQLSVIENKISVSTSHKINPTVLACACKGVGLSAVHVEHFSQDSNVRDVDGLGVVDFRF